MLEYFSFDRLEKRDLLYLKILHLLSGNRWFKLWSWSFTIFANNDWSFFLISRSTLLFFMVHPIRLVHHKNVLVYCRYLLCKAKPQSSIPQWSNDYIKHMIFTAFSIKLYIYAMLPRMLRKLFNTGGSYFRKELVLRKYTALCMVNTNEYQKQFAKNNQ